jgi:hypothetical protein
VKDWSIPPYLSSHVSRMSLSSNVMWGFKVLEKQEFWETSTGIEFRTRIVFALDRALARASKRGEVEVAK